MNTADILLSFFSSQISSHLPVLSVPALHFLSFTRLLWVFSPLCTLSIPRPPCKVVPKDGLLPASPCLIGRRALKGRFPRGAHGSSSALPQHCHRCHHSWGYLLYSLHTHTPTNWLTCRYQFIQHHREHRKLTIFLTSSWSSFLNQVGDASSLRMTGYLSQW